MVPQGAPQPGDRGRPQLRAGVARRCNDLIPGVAFRCGAEPPQPQHRRIHLDGHGNDCHGNSDHISVPSLA